MTQTIPNRQARRFFMQRQGLAEPPARRWGTAGLYDAIERLGFVQVDSVNVLERAHHHILYARNQTYRQGHLSRLVEKERLLFENWTHDASVIPSALFPYWRHRFARERVRLRTRWKDHFGHDSFDDDLDRVRDHVARDGPVMARDFEGDKPSTGWWDWHPSKAALEYLWRTGELAIARREGFQKVYDLAERVIPAEHFSRAVSREDYVDWACRSALERLGMGTRGEIAAFWALLSPEEVETWLSDHRGELESLRVEPADGAKPQATFAFAFAGTADAIAAAPPPPARLRVLSPFDPLLRDRKRAERLFGFFYRIEIFVPEARRKYGYYVFPVMRGDAVIGRIDMKADREADRLAVRAFWPEPRVRVSQALLAQLDAELDRMRRFAGVATVSFEDGWLREA
ncbi:MAG: YcaQ family DNA glycosylase [Rhizobiales bacterium]|nr:YcaQ family DNA glycosylase [Hyphomicrobiales bacterium]OJU37012.1 MAG: hypothetical protein BGN94_07635 [Rhizobiales bacterium 68-8]